ncbi:MAG: exonuclease SbcCD subunit D [Leptolyngbya sp.]|nr:exonuclease SbcCD subunit D [Candidatus Melainabacteria bacterium]
MAPQIIHVSDIHFGSGESHGRVNPITGLNIRFEDFVGALAKVVDYSIEHKIDVFLFSGDAYRNASPEPVYQKMFARQLKRLSDADIKTILVVGNHDQILRSTTSHALSVFQSLEVPGVLTVDAPVFQRLETKSGPIQLIGIPHLTKHQLMTLDKYADKTAKELDRILVDHTRLLLAGYYEELDPEIPTVVTAHMTVDIATAGIEEELLIGYTQTFPTDIFIHKNIDYVALGHVHKFQTIRESSPCIVYSGSLERVDFGEESQDKGFVHVILERNKTTWKFVSIKPRPFITIEADVTGSEDPTAHLVKKIQAGVEPGCVLRVRYKVDQTQLPDIREDLLRKAASAALSSRFLPEIIVTHSRARLPQLNESIVSSPMVALDTYLEEVAPERKERLMTKARDIMNEISLELTEENGAAKGQRRRANVESNEEVVEI